MVTSSLMRHGRPCLSMCVLSAPTTAVSASCKWSRSWTWFWTLIGRNAREVRMKHPALCFVLSQSSDNPIPRPQPIEEIPCDQSKPYPQHDSCFPLEATSEPAWSLNEVFGRPIKGACPLAAEGPASETVCINVQPEREIKIETSAKYREAKYEDGLLRCYELPSKFTPWNLLITS